MYDAILNDFKLSRRSIDRLPILFLLLLFFETIYGQKVPQNILDIIKTDKEFSSFSKISNTKDAFLTFLSKDAVLFRKGKIVNGIEFFSTKEKTNELLTWEPVWADVSLGGDIGYTTGTFEFRKNRDQIEPSNIGYYLSVWKKENDHWRTLIDFGINVPLEIKTHHNSLQFNRKKSHNNYKTFPENITKFSSLAYQYEEELNRNKISLDKKYLAKEFRIYRPNELPFSSLKDLEKLYEKDKVFYFKQHSFNMSSTGDLAYTYGIVSIVYSNNKNIQNKQGGYLRIWKRKNKYNWEITLDIISI